MDIKALQESQTPPPLFERGAPMWHDPYISTQMLTYHITPSHDIASRRPEIIDKTVDWMRDHLNLSAGSSLLDLGCGPGLYTRRFAEKGLQVTGVDYSQNSIVYARKHDPQSTYLCQDYNELALDDASFDVIMMIYGDFCVLSDEERDRILSKIHQLLKPSGAFVFDVTKPSVHAYLKDYRQWWVAPSGGFWSPEPHLVLEQGFAFEDDNDSAITLEQIIVILNNGQQTLYRNWYHDYTPETITPVLENAGFKTVEVYADLTGTPYAEDSEWCGVVARLEG